MRTPASGMVNQLTSVDVFNDVRAVKECFARQALLIRLA